MLKHYFLKARLPDVYGTLEIIGSIEYVVTVPPHIPLFTTFMVALRNNFPKLLTCFSPLSAAEAG